jgi:hypothetical protein
MNGKGLSETRKKSYRRAGDPAEIQREHLPNTNLERYL